MKKKLIHVSLFLIVSVLLLGAVSFAGSLTPPGSVANTMYSLTDIYNLGAGTTTTVGSGTIPATPGTVASSGKTLTEVYTAISTEIAKLSSSVIASGTTAFGITGSTSVVNTSDATATSADIISPKTGYVNGVKITGVAYPSKTLQTFGSSTTDYCYDNVGNLISCVGTGQDGAYQTGQPRSYTDNNDGTITDNATGLMWQKCTVGKSGTSCGTGSATLVGFDTALSTCEALTLASHSDWRLPNINELSSLIDFGLNSPAIDPVFPGMSIYYISSSYSRFASSYAWFVNFNNGAIDTTAKGNGHSVRCVR